MQRLYAGRCAGGLSLVCALAGCSAVPAVESGVEVPARFDEHRIFVQPVSATGDTMVFYTDTGGGQNMLYAHAAETFGVASERVAMGSDTLTLADWPDWREDRGIPQPVDTTGPLAGRLVIVPFSGQASMIQDSSDAGFLGRLWFADRVWTFDYPARRLLVHTADAYVPDAEGRTVPLGFHADSLGHRTTQFPRIRIAVEGDSLDLLFDTGATMVLTDSALSALGDGRPARRASSFLSAAVFDRWRDAHPDWRVIERATALGADLIEVPRVHIAGHAVGPVWFERRDVGVFEEYMSRWMDEPIVGALGGNALRFFRVTVDYPNAVATFEPPQS